jgi:hypothetical protein
VLVAVHDALNRFWWLAAAGLALAGLLLLVAVWPRTWDAAIETNDRVIRAHKPEMLIELSLVLIVLSLVGAVPVALLG